MRDALISRSEKKPAWLQDRESCIYYRHYNIWSFKQCILQTLELSLFVVCSSRDLLKLLVSRVLFYEKPCSDWRRSVCILIRYLHILQSSLSKTESVRTEAVLVTVCLSLCWLWEGKENYQGRGGEKVNKKLAKRDKWRMTLMGCTEQNMCLENKDGGILWVRMAISNEVSL